MKKLYFLLFCWLFTQVASAIDTENSLPLQIFSGLQGKHHVQGIVVNLEKNYVCFSFTTRLIKTDLQGRLIGSVEGLTGHLGCLTLHPEEGRIYGSLEYKNDAIGKGIAGKEASARESAFYVAIFDPDKIVRPNMNAEKDGVMTTVCLPEVANDYYAQVEHKQQIRPHRYGCSGIDGLTFAPQPGDADSPWLLHVAYGVYGDTTRTDNDYQVLLSYDTKVWKGFEQPLSESNPHREGPKKPDQKYFVFTGNTHYGIQNLAYDATTGQVFAAVYPGRQKAYPNYSLFLIDWQKPAQRESLKGFDSSEVQQVLSLAPAGLYDENSQTYGWHFKWGATGLCPLGNGYYYISQPASTPEQSSTLQLYKWSEKAEQPFVEVTLP